MKISRGSVGQIDFEGLAIVDYTSGHDLSSSIAEIAVPPGAQHPRAYSRRSDKYYYSISGRVEFDVDGRWLGLDPGDVCVILKGQRFSYRNTSEQPAKLVLVHTPSFDFESEAFEELSINGVGDRHGAGSKRRER
jgi:mannose-6-phosphate isomerase-like protein (cupin superfamily)